jgi:hypothetical protein
MLRRPLAPSRLVPAIASHLSMGIITTIFRRIPRLLFDFLHRHFFLPVGAISLPRNNRLITNPTAQPLYSSIHIINIYVHILLCLAYLFYASNFSHTHTKTHDNAAVLCCSSHGAKWLESCWQINV